jgi:hypothetical protein
MGRKKKWFTIDRSLNKMEVAITLRKLLLEKIDVKHKRIIADSG